MPRHPIGPGGEASSSPALGRRLVTSQLVLFCCENRLDPGTLPAAPVCPGLRHRRGCAAHTMSVQSPACRCAGPTWGLLTRSHMGLPETAHSTKPHSLPSAEKASCRVSPV